MGMRLPPVKFSKGSFDLGVRFSLSEKTVILDFLKTRTLMGHIVRRLIYTLVNNCWGIFESSESPKIW